MADARALSKEGFQHYANDRLDEAVDCYRRAVDADPGLAIAWNGLALVLQRQGDLDAAIDAAKRLIALEPDEALGHTTLSRIYQQKGMIPEAEDEMAKATQLQFTKR